MNYSDNEQATPAMARLPDLETVTIWEGVITNERIRSLLGVKPVYASRLLSSLSRHLFGRAERSTPHAPLEMLYSHSSDTKPKSPDEYLRLLSSLGPQAMDEETILDARVDLSLVSPEVFSYIQRAIVNRRAIKIEYRSMNHPSGTTRVVFPHSLVRAPRRWHMRAWCVQREDYRDFTLGRIAAVESTSLICEKVREEDTKWNRVLDLAIGPHPLLGPDQRKMIAAEFFPGASLLKLKVRECLAPYVIQDLRVAVNANQQTPPDYQLALLNADALNLEF
jgi:hypothetical protein